MVTKELQELIKDRVKRTGKLSSQKTWEQELKAKAQADKKVRKGQQTLTSGVSTSRRLSEFEDGTLAIKGDKPKLARLAKHLQKEHPSTKGKMALFDPKTKVKLVSGIPQRWYEAMVMGIKKRSDVRNPYAIVKNIWARLPAHTRSDILKREKAGERFHYDLPLPDDRQTRGIGTLRMVKPFNLAEAQVNVSKKDMDAVKKSGIFRPMKREDGSICQVARCKGARPVNIFVDEV